MENKHLYKSDCERGEVEIFAVETGKDWLNILWNERGCQTVVTHTGATTSCRVTQDSERINLNADKSSVIYIRDDDSGEFFNPGGYPCGVMPQSFRCVHAQSYSTVSGERDGLRASLTVTLHPDELCELRRVTVENTSERARHVSVYALTVFDLGGYPMPFYYNAPTTSATEYVREANAVLCLSQNPYGGMAEKSGFSASLTKPHSVCGNLGDFTGIAGGLAVPRALTCGGGLSGGMATVRDRAAILRHKLTVKAGGKKELYYVAGFVKDRQELISLAASVWKQIPAIMRRAQKDSSAQFAELATRSPSAQINTVLNHWAQKQVSYCCIGKKAVRDNAQLAVALLDYAPDEAKKTIEECLCHQYRDGHAMLLWYPVAETSIYSDPAFWLVIAAAEYVKETGDTAFLGEKYPYFDGGEDSVLGHIEAGVNWYLDDRNYGSHGLPKIYKADWNDALNIPDENAESTFMAACVCYMLGEVSELYRYLGDSGKAEKLAAAKQKLADTFNRVAFNGEYYVRALSKFGNVGDKGCEGGEFYFNPQSWAIMAGIVPPERMDKLLKAIDDRVTDEGVAMCVPPYPRYDSRVGRMSGMLPGVYENGGIYNHAGCFKVMADCALGRGDEAARTLLTILPDGKFNPSSRTDLEPYVFSNCYLKHPSVNMKVASSWQTGTSAWGLRCYYDGILGIRRAYDGLKIAPCLPSDWKSVTATRRYRGSTYLFEYENGGGSEVTLYLDGKRLPGNVLPPQAKNGRYRVTVKVRESGTK